VVSDRWQNRHIGTGLMKALVEVGRQEKLSRILGYILPENHAMQHVCKKAGFELHHDTPGECKAIINL